MTAQQEMIYTADVVAIAKVADEWHVLLGERDWEPFKGFDAFPGGHVDPEDVDSRDTARREFLEEVGLRVSRAQLVFVDTWDAPGRDPRGPYSTDVFGVEFEDGAEAPMAGSDLRSARWVPVREARQRRLAFDHSEILEQVATEVEKKLGKKL